MSRVESLTTEGIVAMLAEQMELIIATYETITNSETTYETIANAAIKEATFETIVGAGTKYETITNVAVIQTIANDAIPSTQKGAASGVSTLDATSHIPVEQMPTEITSPLMSVSNSNPAGSTPCISEATICTTPSITGDGIKQFMISFKWYAINSSIENDVIQLRIKKNGVMIDGVQIVTLNGTGTGILGGGSFFALDTPVGATVYTATATRVFGTGNCTINGGASSPCRLVANRIL